jgi:hypothetical protein
MALRILQSLSASKVILLIYLEKPLQARRVRRAVLRNLLYWLSDLHIGGVTRPRFRVGVYWMLDSDELKARLGAGPDGPLDI